MFLKKLWETYKIHSGHRHLQKQIAELPLPVIREKGIARIGCLVDVDHFPDVAVFYELQTLLSLKPDAVKIIGYTSKDPETLSYTIPLFSDRDLGWRGGIKNKEVAAFIKQEYDLLLNYYDQDHLMLELVSVATPARLKVGLGTVDPNMNDLILHLPLKDFNGFKDELKKYLTILNEL